MIEKEFISFRKIPRWSRDIVITEKIDGTNAQILNGEMGEFLVGSRSRWITPGKTTDNYGFAAWAYDNKEELQKLGPGRHYGEWWGQGIQRGYGLSEKRFSLFDVAKWESGLPTSVVGLVPVIYKGPMSEQAIEDSMSVLRSFGSRAAVGYKNPEGIVIRHTASGYLFKKTLENDDTPKLVLMNKAVNNG